jgi:hypothetical protein
MKTVIKHGVHYQILHETVFKPYAITKPVAPNSILWKRTGKMDSKARQVFQKGRGIIGTVTSSHSYDKWLRKPREQELAQVEEAYQEFKLADKKYREALKRCFEKANKLSWAEIKRETH